MKIRLRSELVALPTTDSTNLYKLIDEVWYSVAKNDDNSMHLYVVTDLLEINEGDWFYICAPNVPKIHQCTSIKNVVGGKMIESDGYSTIDSLCKKVIATTKDLPNTADVHNALLEEYGKTKGTMCYADISFNTESNTLDLDDDGCVISYSVKPQLYTHAQLVSYLNKYREYVWKQGATRKDLDDWITANVDMI